MRLVLHPSALLCWKPGSCWQRLAFRFWASFHDDVTMRQGSKVCYTVLVTQSVGTTVCYCFIQVMALDE